jgi:FlaA1/EpsC-like NDP-sugar epimerase
VPHPARTGHNDHLCTRFSLTLSSGVHKDAPAPLLGGSTVQVRSTGAGWGDAGVLAGTHAQRNAVREATTRIPRAVYNFARRADSTSLGLLDAGVITVAWLVALFAGFEGEPNDAGGLAFVFVALPSSTQLVTNRLAGLYGPVWRYASIEEATRVVVAVGAGAALSWIELMILARTTDITVPVFTMPPIAALLILLGCGGIRFQARLFALERQSTRRNGHIRTVIVGTNNAGVGLARELDSGGGNGNLRLVGFVDGDRSLSHRSIRGLPVLGATADLHAICQEHAVDRILVALPQAERDETKSVVELALKTNAQVKVLPRASDLIDKPLVQGLRDINLEDLVGREHAPVDAAGIGEFLRGASVLVTGAGGSIGSEIARQVVRYGPSKLILLDRDDSLLCETAVGDLADSELILANICDKGRMADVFAVHRPDIVFHAAAHKHVPILEDHPVEALQANLLATWWLAATAARHDCRMFVHISTDKAVNPCSVMGASKRAAELAVFAVGRSENLPCAVVRFGNVIGSRGSVVPVFLRQILDGGPVTLTDPDMKRYFMTIPEAVSLVLQAGSMQAERKIFLLDMGEPASILHMARQMIRLAGLRPDEDIEIEVTGRRRGERLIEKLHDDDESVEPTSHPSIWSVKSTRDCEPSTLIDALGTLERDCAEANSVVAIQRLDQLLRASGVPCALGNDRSADVAPGPFVSEALHPGNAMVDKRGR